jgi:hypothetical protein
VNVPRKATIKAACHQMMMYISVEGLGSMNNSNGMYRFLHEGFELGFKEVCINLALCDGMDSTFMGTLLLIHEEAVNAGGGLFLVNLSDYNRSKLEELGVAHFLKIGSVEVPDVVFDVLPADGDQGGRMSLVLKAHEELVRKNSVNEEVFGSFIKALRSSFQ